MKPTSPQEESGQGILQALRKVFAKLFCCSGGKTDRPTDDQIRESIGGTSATSTHRKPGKSDEQPR